MDGGPYAQAFMTLHQDPIKQAFCKIRYAQSSFVTPPPDNANLFNDPLLPPKAAIVQTGGRGRLEATDSSVTLHSLLQFSCVCPSLCFHTPTFARGSGWTQPCGTYLERGRQGCLIPQEILVTPECPAF